MIVEQAIDVVRKEAEGSDHVQGFQIRGWNASLRKIKIPQNASSIKGWFSRSLLALRSSFQVHCGSLAAFPLSEIKNSKSKNFDFQNLSKFRRIAHSLGGGTGSGLGTLLLLKIRDAYPDRYGFWLENSLCRSKMELRSVE